MENTNKWMDEIVNIIDAHIVERDLGEEY